MVGIRQEVLAALEQNDFVDHTKREDAATVTARKQAVTDVLSKRGEVFLQSPIRLLGFWIRVWWRHICRLKHAEARQGALSDTMSIFIPRFWPLQETQKPSQIHFN